MSKLKEILGLVVFIAMMFAAYMVSPWMLLGFLLVVALALFKK